MLIFSLLLLFGSLNIARPIGLIRELAIASILYGTVILLLILILKNKSSRFNRSFFPAFTLIVAEINIYLLGTAIYGFQVKGFKVFLQVVFLLIFFFTMYLLDWEEKRLEHLSTTFLLFVWSCLIKWMFDGMPISFYKGHTANQNSFGSMLLLSSFFLLIPLVSRNSKTKRFIHAISIILTLFLMYASGARSTWLSMLMIFIVFFLWKRLAKSKTRFSIFFIIFILGLIVAFITYIQLPMSPLGKELNNIIHGITGKNFFSGRQIIWSILIDAVIHRPWFGYGSGTTPSDVSWISLSAHNWYLQTALQVGFIGLVVFVALFYSIWLLLWRGRNDNIVRLAASFMIGILVHQMFEVSLTQNNMGTALLQWLIISIACSRSISIGFSYNIHISSRIESSSNYRLTRKGYLK